MILLLKFLGKSNTTDFLQKKKLRNKTKVDYPNKFLVQFVMEN